MRLDGPTTNQNSETRVYMMINLNWSSVSRRIKPALRSMCVCWTDIITVLFKHAPTSPRGRHDNYSTAAIGGQRSAESGEVALVDLQRPERLISEGERVAATGCCFIRHSRRTFTPATQRLLTHLPSFNVKH